MDIHISSNRCGNKNCIGIPCYEYGKVPERLMVIEDVWILPDKIIEQCIDGLISHETIEWILIKFNPTMFEDLHGLIGVKKIKDYKNNFDGLPLVPIAQTF